MSCGCDKKKQTPACEQFPEYRDSEVLGGGYWPAISGFPLEILDGGTLPVSSLSDVRRTLLVNVTSGVAHMWWKHLAGQ